MQLASLALSPPLKHFAAGHGPRGNGAELVTTEMVAFEWLRTAEHEGFKEILGLVK